MRGVGAAILAGGQSRRFGRDKALAELGGRSLLARVAASLDACAPKLIVAPPGRYALPGWQPVPDTRPGEGPLAGLEAALGAAPGDWVALSAVDLPLLTPAYWALLAQHRRPGAQFVAGVAEGGGTQVLAALYHVSARPLASALLDAGERRLRALEAMLRPVHVPWDAVRAVAPDAFRNANTPEDLAGLDR